MRRLYPRAARFGKPKILFENIRIAELCHDDTRVGIGAAFAEKLKHMLNLIKPAKAGHLILAGFFNIIIFHNADIVIVIERDQPHKV